MRYVTGFFGVVAALAFVGYSATTTYFTAYGMTTEFKELAGWAAAGVVLWECLGLLFVRQCWQNGARLLAIGGLCLVGAAAIYTVRLDLRFNVAGQSDFVATRQNSVQRLDGVKSELIKARLDRDVLRRIKKPTDAQIDDLVRVEKRIDALEAKWDTSTVVSTPMPEAGWASRMMGKVSTDEGWWTDALMVGGMLFWALARMLALPVAVASMQSVARKPVQAALAPKAMDVAPAPSMAVLARPLRAELTPRLDLSRKLVASSPEIPDSSPSDEPTPPADAKPAEEAEPGEGGGGMPAEKVAVKLEIVTDDYKPRPPLSRKQRKQMERERLKDEAIRAVEEFAAARLDLTSANARFVRSDKDFVKSGGTPGTELGKEFRKWAGANRKWRHFATYKQNPLGKAMSVVLEAGRPTNGGGSVYAALLRKEANAIAA